jgi:hypothetical protein
VESTPVDLILLAEKVVDATKMVALAYCLDWQVLDSEHLVRATIVMR